MTKTDDDYIYQYERYSVDGYRFQVPNGKYTVRLHFAETFAPGIGRRVFSVFLQGKEKFIVDIYKEVGENTALIKTIGNVNVTDGEIKIDFVGMTSKGCQEINGIEVIKE